MLSRFDNEELSRDIWTLCLPPVPHWVPQSVVSWPMSGVGDGRLEYKSLWFWFLLWSWCFVSISPIERSQKSPWERSWKELTSGELSFWYILFFLDVDLDVMCIDFDTWIESRWKWVTLEPPFRSHCSPCLSGLFPRVLVCWGKSCERANYAIILTQSSNSSGSCPRIANLRLR